MSTFNGVIKEYPSVRVDRFEGSDIDETPFAFFLSHCHKDHMVGLDGATFDTYLKKINKSHEVRIYMSSVSRKLLLNDGHYSHLDPYIIDIPLQEPTTIPLPNNDKQDENLLVTLIPSGHCPGSVMFLFEGDGGTVLYTGDFRFSVGDVQRISHLHSADGKVKPIKSLYVDTTFCLPETVRLPSRQDTLLALLELTESWLNASSNHLVWLDCKTQYGYEHIFLAIRKQLGTRVHVNHEKFRRYQGIPEIEDALTTDGTSTRIHCCRSMRFPVTSKQVPCRSVSTICVKETRVMKIKPSCLWYLLHRISKDTVFKVENEDDSFRVCYSMHSSLTEVRDMIRHLSPKNIYPNVVPENVSEIEIMNFIHPPEDSVNGNDVLAESEVVVPLGTLKGTRPLGCDYGSSDSESSLIFDSFEDHNSIGKSPSESEPASTKDAEDLEERERSHSANGKEFSDDSSSRESECCSPKKKAKMDDEHWSSSSPTSSQCSESETCNVPLQAQVANGDSCPLIDLTNESSLSSTSEYSADDSDVTPSLTPDRFQTQECITLGDSDCSSSSSSSKFNEGEVAASYLEGGKQDESTVEANSDGHHEVNVQVEEAQKSRDSDLEGKSMDVGAELTVNSTASGTEGRSEVNFVISSNTSYNPAFGEIAHPSHNTSPGEIDLPNSPNRTIETISDSDATPDKIFLSPTWITPRVLPMAEWSDAGQNRSDQVIPVITLEDDSSSI